MHVVSCQPCLEQLLGLLEGGAARWCRRCRQKPVPGLGPEVGAACAPMREDALNRSNENEAEVECSEEHGPTA